MADPPSLFERDNRPQALALWLLLLSIFTHVAVPAASPVQSTGSSALSASIADASLAPRRTALSVRAPLLDDDDGGASDSDGDDPFGDAASQARPSLIPAGDPPPARSTSAIQAGGAAFYSARAPPGH